MREMTKEHIQHDACSDMKVTQHALNKATELLSMATTATVITTSICKVDHETNHVTCAVVSRDVGYIDPGTARTIVSRLRSLADELEQRFCPPN